jgi:hypothetical protein
MLLSARFYGTYWPLYTVIVCVTSSLHQQTLYFFFILSSLQLTRTGADSKFQASYQISMPSDQIIPDSNRNSMGIDFATEANHCHVGVTRVMPTTWTQHKSSCKWLAVCQLHLVPTSGSNGSALLLRPGGQHSLWPPLTYTPPNVQQ